MAISLHSRQLRERILNDRYNRIVFSAAQSRPLYLVGGYLRDILRGKTSMDRDYITEGDHESLLAKIVDETGGKLVRIGDYLHRVVLKDNSTLDFTPLLNDIAYDLAKRDFTVNSIAWSPGTGLIDPFGGSNDLVKERIRMISRENIENDPIRILRAYRFAGECGMQIENKTRKALKDLSFRLLEAKGERITLEIFKILNLHNQPKMLRMMLHDGVMNRIFPLNTMEFQRRLRAISRLNRILHTLPLKDKEMPGVQFSQNLSYSGLLRLEVLLEGVKSSVLIMSSKILKRLCEVEKGRQILTRGNWSNDSLFEAFRVMQDATADLLLQRGRVTMLSEYERYRTIEKTALLSVPEIVLETGIPHGRRLGEMIRLVQRAEFNRQIRSKESALLFLRSIQHNLT